MHYKEFFPDDVFSHHIECYWQMAIDSVRESNPVKLLLPTCTFNLIFTNKPCFVQIRTDSNWIPVLPGAVFFGQRNNCIKIKTTEPLELCGVRFKPFAFAKIIKTPIFQLNDNLISIDELFEITPSMSSLITQIIKAETSPEKIQFLDDLMEALFRKSFAIDETLRAQLNYIMDRRGAVKISELFEEFNTSKVTLRKHFINKVGLSPKKVSQIWRMNYLLKMKEDNPDNNLTTLCLNAGFYDQAHFIKDFKLLFGLPPRKFFTQSSPLIKVAHQSISKRFTNQYDPR